MARWLAVLLVLALAGCLGSSNEDTSPGREEPLAPDGAPITKTATQTKAPKPPAPEPEFVEDPAKTQALWGNRTVMRLAAGSVEWHRGDAYNQVTQPIAHPCAWQPNEVYFNNQHLTTVGIPYGTAKVGFTFDWDDESYLREELRAAHRGEADDAYIETAPFGRMVEVQVGIDIAEWGPPDADRPSPTWELWACMDTDSLEAVFPPSIFVGDIRFTLDAYRTSPAAAAP